MTAPTMNGNVGDPTLVEIPPEVPVDPTPLDAARAFIAKYVALSDVQLDALTLWCAHSHAFEAAESTPYIAITSTGPGSGKTRLLEVLELLVANPWLTGRVTGPALVRKVDAEHPTLLLDETDALFTGAVSSQQMLRGVINSGYRLGGKTSYASGGGYKDLDTFCPKAFAGIGGLPRTIADRSVPIVMRKRTAFTPIARLVRRTVRAEVQVPRMLLVRFGAQNVNRLGFARPEIPSELDDRAADVWEPLLAIADAIGGTWPQRAREAAVVLCSHRKEADTDGIQFRLLSDVKQAFDRIDADRLKTETLLEALHALEEAPWSEIDGKPLDARGLADALRGFGVGPKKIRFGRVALMGYARSSVEAAWRMLVTEEDSA
jgi:hypothetical protein